MFETTNQVGKSVGKYVGKYGNPARVGRVPF